MPKGVELTGRNIGCALHELHASIELDEGSVCAAPVPFFHVAGLGMLLAVLVPTVLQRLLALPEARTADWSALSRLRGPRGSRCPCSATPPRSSAARSCSPTA